MGKKDKEDKKGSEEHNVHALLGQPALVQIVDRGLPGKSDQEKKVTTTILANLKEAALANCSLRMNFLAVHSNIAFSRCSAAIWE